MSNIALITGADRGLGFALIAGLLDKGWDVVAGQYMPEWTALVELRERYPQRLHLVPLDVGSTESVHAAAALTLTLVDHLDLLINNAGVISGTGNLTIRETQNYAEIERIININAVGPIRVAEAFLPLLDKGALKRLCFVSSEASSIERCMRTGWYGYTMSKAALNMAVKNMFNHLQPEGFTFRLYHPGWIRSYMSGTKNKEATLEPEEAAAYALEHFLNPLPHEDRLTLTDYLGHEWQW